MVKYTKRDINEDIETILEELQLVRPEVLEPKAKRLFDAIMCIAYDRDKYLKENQKLKEDITFCLQSIKREMEISTDERTRKEMSTYYEILKGDCNE